MKRLLYYYSIVTLVLIAPSVSAATALENTVRSFLEEDFVTAALLSDTDVINLGFWSFDPNSYTRIEDEKLGSQESIDTRNSLKQFSLPLRWQLSQYRKTDTLWFVTKAAYMEVDQEVNLFPEAQIPPDRIIHKNVSLGLGLEYEMDLTEHWGLELGVYTNWMRYRNRFYPKSTQSRLVEPYLDGLLTNIDVKLLMAEPVAGANYNWSGRTSRYQLYSNYHYLNGKSLDAKIDAHEARPESWYWANGFALQKPVFTRYLDGHSLWFRVARINIGSQLSNQLGPSHYYEAGVAWIVKTKQHLRLLDNFGIGVNLNYGSSLRGGTLILLYNFDAFD